MLKKDVESIKKIHKPIPTLCIIDPTKIPKSLTDRLLFAIVIKILFKTDNLITNQ
jgi:hypothetical protein